MKSERPVFDQVIDALGSEVDHGVVRAWLWVYIVECGITTIGTYRETIEDADRILDRGQVLGLFTYAKGQVRALEWLSRDTEPYTAPPESKPTVGTYHTPLEEVVSVVIGEGDMFRPPQKERTLRKKRSGDSPVREKLETLTGPEKLVFAFGNPRSKFSREVIREAAARMGRAYAKAYRAKTGKDYWPAMIVKHSARFEEMVKWCSHHGIRYDEWLRFCSDAYRKLAKVRTFPSPANCAGPWIMDAWLESQAPATHRHAGHGYAKLPQDIRKKLIGAGFEVAGYDDEMLDWIGGLARDKRKVPEMYEPDSPEIEAIVEWMLDNEVV